MAHFVLFSECISGISDTGTLGFWRSQMDTGEGCGGFEEDELTDYLLISQNESSDFLVMSQHWGVMI